MAGVLTYPQIAWQIHVQEYFFLENVICSLLLQYLVKCTPDTVKPVLSGHSRIDKTKIFMTNGSLMKVQSIAECSPWSILQYF